MDSKSEIISRLEKVEDLYCQTIEIDNYIKYGVIEEAKNQLKIIRTNLGELTNQPSIFLSFPVFNKNDGTKLEFLNKKMKKSAKVLKITLIAIILCLMICWIFLKSFPETVATAGFFAIIGIFIWNHNNKEYYKREKTSFDNEEKIYNESMHKFHSSLIKYTQEKSVGVIAAEEYSLQLANAYKEYEHILNSIEKNKAEAISKYSDLVKDIENEGIIQKEYLYLTSYLILLLKSGRADTLKEALNLAIEEERQTKIENQRRAEEERRTYIMQQQMENQRQHNLEMERQAAARVEAERESAKVATDNARKQAERLSKDARLSNMEAQKSADMRCARCANHDACGKSRGIINCGAFTPKRY